MRGIAAGLHAAVELPAGTDAAAVLDEARRRRIALGTIAGYRTEPGGGPPTLLLGYAQTPEPAIRAGVRELAAAVHAARATRPATRRSARAAAHRRRATA